MRSCDPWLQTPATTIEKLLKLNLVKPEEVKDIRAMGHLPGPPLEEGKFVDIRKGVPYAFIVDKSRGERPAVDKKTGEAKVLQAFIPAK